MSFARSEIWAVCKHRYPVQPLAHCLNIKVDYPRGGRIPEGQGQIGFAKTIGVHTKQVLRAFDHGLDFWQADRWAVRSGFHPWSVWPEMAIDEIEHIGDLARMSDGEFWQMPLCDGCGAGHRSNRRYCSRRCLDRVAQRRQRERSKA